MEDLQIKLELYRDMVISRLELEQSLASNVYKLKPACPIEVDNIHLIEVLTRYREGIITRDRLIEWVNVVWFSDAFDYSEEHQDSIASVMTVLEELDEGNVELTRDEIDKYILALSMNLEI